MRDLSCEQRRAVLTRVAARARVRIVAALALGTVLLVRAPSVAASPIFDLHVSTGCVGAVEIGERLQLFAFLPTPGCLPPPYLGRSRTAPDLARMPLRWKVEPEALATIGDDGMLAALGAGQVHVTVECRDPKRSDCTLIAPGQTWLQIAKELPRSRMPFIDGGPAVDQFGLGWDTESRKAGARPALQLHLGGIGYAWAAVLTSVAVLDQPLPWTIDRDVERTWFEDDEGREDQARSYPRWKANVKSARITITSWKDGIAAGRLEFRAIHGIEFDVKFVTWLADVDGVLARAAAPTPALPAAAAPEPAMSEPAK